MSPPASPGDFFYYESYGFHTGLRGQLSSCGGPALFWKNGAGAALCYIQGSGPIRRKVRNRCGADGDREFHCRQHTSQL